MGLGINNPLPASLNSECQKCARILTDFVDPSAAMGPDKVIPPEILRNAHGLAILSIVKIGFLASVRTGSGLVIAKLGDGSWSAPSAIGIGGLGFGSLAGAEIADFVFVLNDASAVRAFSQQGSVTLGGNISVAAGPYGRNAEAAGAASLKGVAAVFSFARSKGVFIGVSLEGSAIIERKDANEKLYGYRVSASQLLEGALPPPPEAEALINVLNSTAFSRRRGRSDTYNDNPVYDQSHDELIWGKNRGLGYGEKTRYRDPVDRDNDYRDHPSRASTWEDDTYDRDFGFGSNSRARSDSAPGRPAAPKPHFKTQAQKEAELKGDQAIALFTFKAEQPEDLGFKKGDIITILKRTDKANDWWTGRLGDKEGTFPSNYVDANFG